jgi:hypothetical protein
MGGMRAALGGLIVIAVAVVPAIPAGAAPDRDDVRRPGPPRVLLVGDSLTLGYADEATAALRANGYEVLTVAVGMTGLLDRSWCRAQVAKMLAPWDADTVVYENTGNYMGQHCSPTTKLGTNGFYNQWRRSAKRTQRNLTRNGARFLWMLNPATQHAGYDTVVPKLNGIYEGLGTETVDAWDAFGSWTYNPDLHDAGGLHLSQEGQEVMADEVVDAVTEGGS